MTKDDDLVKRLRKRQEFEFIDGYKRIEWEDDDALVAADRIEELEAKLAKAEVIVRIIASAEFDERIGEAVDLSCEYLAGLEGGSDE